MSTSAAFMIANGYEPMINAYTHEIMLPAMFTILSLTTEVIKNETSTSAEPIYPATSNHSLKPMIKLLLLRASAVRPSSP